MWRRFKGHNQTPQPDESQEDIAESNNQPISDNRTSKEVEVSSKKKYQLPGTAQFPSKNSKNKRKSLRMEDKSADNTTKSQGTSTSKKSFWRARKLSSPTTKRSKEQRQSSRTSSKKSNIEFSTKSRKSSSSQNSNPIYLETLGANVTERKIEAETQSDTNFKSSKLTSRHSLKKNANNHDINKTTSTSANHPFEAIVVPDDLAELKNQNREYNREIKTARPYIVDQTILPRQYSTPANSSQQTVVTTARSISTPADHSITAVHINDRNGGDPLHRHSIGSNKRPGRITSRFSLRRLFYGNNIAQPAIFRTLGTRASIEIAAASKTARFVEDNQSDTKSTVWRDNTSSCSSLQGGATAAISLGGNSTAASLMVHAGGSASSTVLKECPLCLSECTLDLFPLLRNCHHLFCIDCLQTYVKIEIQEGRVNLRCPQCTELMHPNDIETLIGDKNSNLLTLYESLMLRRLLAVDPDTRWCPGPNCTYAVIAAGCASCPKITCERPGCGYSFCYHCKAEWHPNQTCDAARAQRNQNQGTMIGSALPMALRSSSGTFSLEAINAAGGAVPGSAAGVINGSMGVPSNSGQTSEVKVCPRCNTLIVKMDDGSCNHMTCPVCGAEFCWLCMKEISDLHYLSPSGCTFWGKKPWSRKKKLLWQLGTLVGAPVGIALLAGIAVPAMIIGIPSWVGRKIHDHYKHKNKHKRNLAVVGGVISSLVISPFLAGLAVSIGVPILLCYVYGVVPIALCRSEGCGVYTTVSGVRIDIDEDDIDMANAASQLANAVMNAGENAAASFRNMKSGNSGANQASLNESRNIDANSENRKTLNIGSSRGHRNQDLVANPSIGEVSLGASLSLGSGCHLNEREQYTDLASRECDRESASNTAVAGASLTGSLASSYLGARNHDHSTITNSQRQEDTHKSGINPPATMMSGIGTYHLQNRLEVDVHNGSRKKFSFSSERLSDQISLSERSGTISMGDGDGARSEASTRALAGSLLAYKLGDSQSVSSYQRVIGERSIGDPTSETTSNVVPASSSSMGYGATSAAGMHEDALSLRSLPLHAAGVHGRVAGADIYPSVAKEQLLQNPSSSIVSVVPPR
jgi:E3 ubiquitin-protein ligase RNF19A